MPAASSRRRSILKLVAFLALCLGTGGVSGVLTASAIPGWYASLAKPSFNPPDAVFSPVWTMLFALMGISAWLAWSTPASCSRKNGLRFFALQLALNFCWSILFFRSHSILGAFVEIILLWLAIAATAFYFSRIQRLAAALLIPYLAWVAFAAVLNFASLRLNPGH